MADPRLPGQRIFDVITHNKQYDKILTDTEERLNKEQRRMLTRHLNDKAALFDELIQLNVRTPNAKQANTPEALKFKMKEVEVDRKWMAQASDKITKLKGSHKVVPLISIEGAEVVCYANEVTKRGRHLTLAPRVNRKILEVQKLAGSIEQLHKGHGARSRANSARPKSCSSLSEMTRRAKLPSNGLRSVYRTRAYSNANELRRPKTAISGLNSMTYATVNTRGALFSEHYRWRSNGHENSSESSDSSFPKLRSRSKSNDSLSDD